MFLGKTVIEGNEDEAAIGNLSCPTARIPARMEQAIDLNSLFIERVNDDEGEPLQRQVVEVSVNSLKGLRTLGKQPHFCSEFVQ
jgi:hypothetical protein